MPMGTASRKRKEARYKMWHLQGRITEIVPNPFPPPPMFQQTSWGDKEEIKAYHIPDLKNVGNEQFQDGIGDFTVKVGTNVGLNDVLRSDELNIYIKIMSEPTVIYEFNHNQIHRFRYQIIDRNEAQSEAERFGF